MVDYRIDVYNGTTWNTDANWLNVTLKRSIFWDTPATANIELDNRNGVTRTAFVVGRQVKIYRNSVLIFYGIITKPKYSVDNNGHHTSVELLDYYRFKLKTKLTGETEQWNLSEVTPANLIRAMIGTKFIHQDTFENSHRIDTMSDVAIQDGTISLVKDASGYVATGYIGSIPLQNGDWNTMGDITGATVYVYPDLQYSNVAPNPGFEEDMPEISTTTNWTSKEWDGVNISSGHRSITRSSTVHRNGSYSIHMVDDHSSPGTQAILGMHNYQFDNKSGQTWQASAYVKGSGGMWIRIMWVVNGTLHTEDHGVTVDSNWQLNTVTKVLPATASQLWMDITTSASGASDIYIDDVSFHRVPADGDVIVQLSQDGGSSYTPITVLYDPLDGRWEATISSFVKNMLYNPGFELGNDNGWVVWDAWTGSGRSYTKVLQNTGAHSGTYCQKITTVGANTTQWLGYVNTNLSTAWYPALTNKEYKAKFWLKGTSRVQIHLFGIDVNGNILDDSGGSLINLTASWTEYTFTHTFTNPNIVKTGVALYIYNAGDTYIDDSDEEATFNNILAYKLTLNRESLTSAPIIEGIEIHATTISDIGITEGTIDEYVPPTGYDSTMAKDFGDTYRDDGISSIYKVVGMEPKINISTGAISFQTTPAKVASDSLTVGTELIVLSSEYDLLSAANALTYTGSGQISDNVNFTHRVDLEDATSIAALNLRIEKSLKGKDLPTTGMVNNRAYNTLQTLKDPPNSVTGTLIDAETTLSVIGAWYTVDDPTGASGLSNIVLRMMSETRKYGTSGETADVTLSTVGYNTDIEAQFGNLIKSVETYRDTAQSSNMDDIRSAVGNCTTTLPLGLNFSIDGNRRVMNIELTMNSEKFKNYGTSTITEYATYAACQAYVNGDYFASSKIPCPAFGVRGSVDATFSVRRLNLTNYYSDDYTNKLQPGSNTIYFVPSKPGTVGDPDGFLYLNATIKVSYAN